jgi:ATP-dependent Clp protease adaptor protein ClpS
MSQRDRDEERKGGVGLKEREEQKVKRPRQYKVLLHNDDFTPVPWVVTLLRHVFRKGESEAMRITMQVHERGIAVCGVYTHEIAETKVAMVHAFATKDGHPLMCTMEPEA